MKRILRAGLILISLAVGSGAAAHALPQLAGYAIGGQAHAEMIQKPGHGSRLLAENIQKPGHGSVARSGYAIGG